ncbi:MAG TPA: hypothetical protein VLA10_02895, partial [Ilumatobacter sp.]|nr:hypothetical protein [Ilumatobacter sp.]
MIDRSARRDWYVFILSVNNWKERRHPMRRSLIATLLVVGLVATACGGDDDDSSGSADGCDNTITDG